MPLPAILDIARKHLYEDVSRLTELGIPRPTIDHLLRLRDVYNQWLQEPSLSDRDIVDLFKSAYGISDTKARSDLQVVKRLLGDMQQTSKNYHRYRFIEMIEETYRLAREKKNLKAMADAAGKYAKYTQLDKPDEQDLGLDGIRPQSFEFTDDPAVLGLTRIPGIKERKKKLLEKYMSDDVQEVQAEEVEWNPEDIFNGVIPYGGLEPEQ